MTKEIYDKLIDFVTIYGDGSVNINTATKPVLMALGLPETLVEKILTARRGKDSIDGTADDMVFLKTYEIAVAVNSVVQLSIEEARAIDALNMRGLLTTNSYYFTIEATGKISSKSTLKSVRAVYASREDRIIYWKER